MSIGIKASERKWGITRQNLFYFIKTKLLFSCKEEKLEWVKAQYYMIADRLNNMCINTIKERVQGILNSNFDTLTLIQLYNICFEQGIAVAALKYKIRLFDLEHLLQYYCNDRWKEMEKNEWFLCSDDVYVNGEKDINSEEIVKLALSEGYVYAGKKFRMKPEYVRKFLCNYYHQKTGGKFRKCFVDHIYKEIDKVPENQYYGDSNTGGDKRDFLDF